MLPPINEGRYAVPKAALKVLNENAGIFSAYLREHVRPICEVLVTLCGSKSNALRVLAEECLENCMKKIAEVMDQGQPADVQNFESLLGRFQSLLRQREDARLLPLAVRAIGTLSTSIKRFKGERLLQTLLQQIVELSQFHIFSEEEELDIKSLAYKQKQFAAFIASYANICASLEFISEEVLLHMSKIGLKVFESNRLIVHKYRPLLTKAIAQLIVALSSQERSFQAWLRVFVSSALSHILSQLDDTLSYDVEKQVFMAAKLWQDMLASEELSDRLKQQVGDEIARYYELMLTTRNLQYSVTPEKACLYASPGDHMALVRAVTFAKAAFPGLAPLVSSWVIPLTKLLAQLIYQLPRISELYRLMKVLLVVAKKTQILAEDLEGSALAATLLKDVVVKLREYEEELLASCLELVLAAPSDLILSQRENNLSLWVPAVKKAVELSATQTRVAHLTITALKTWSKELPKRELEEFLVPILPALSSFLRLDKTGETPGAEESRKKVAYRTVKFLGSLGGLAHSLVPDSVGALHTAWDTEPRVSFALPISTLKLDLYLDPILPRVLILCEQAGDLKTRVTACELLHAVVIYMIGRSAQANVNFSKQFARLLPVVFRLATDMEPVPRQMFEPFTKQVVRWFAKAKTHEHPDTMAVLDGLMEAISDPTNPALRTLGSACLGEFTKVLTKVNLGSDLVPHFKSVLRRVENFSNHPDPYKRIGALRCFKEILPVLETRVEVVDCFLLEVGHVIFVTIRLTSRDLNSQEVSQLCEEVTRDFSLVLSRSIALVLTENPRRAFHRDVSQFLSWLWDLTSKPEELSRVHAQNLWQTLSDLVRIDKARWMLAMFPQMTRLKFEADSKQTLELLAAEVQFVTWTLKSHLMTPMEWLRCDRAVLLEENIKHFLEQNFQTSLAGLKLVTLLQVLEYAETSQSPLLTVKNLLDFLTNNHSAAVNLSENSPELEARLQMLQKRAAGLLRAQRPKAHAALPEYLRSLAEQAQTLSEAQVRIYLEGLSLAISQLDAVKLTARDVRNGLEPLVLEWLRSDKQANVAKAKHVLRLFSLFDLAEGLFTSLLSDARAYQLLGDVILDYVSTHWETVAPKLFQSAGREPDALLPLFPPVLQRVFALVANGKLTVTRVIRSFAAISQTLVQLSRSPVGDYSSAIVRLLTFFLQECSSLALAAEARPELEEQQGLLGTTLDLAQVFTGVEKSVAAKRESMTLMAAIWHYRVGTVPAWTVLLPVLRTMQGKYIPISLVGVKKVKEAPDVDLFVKGFLGIASETGHVEAIRLLYPLMREPDSDYADEIKHCLDGFLASSKLLEDAFTVFGSFLADFQDPGLDTAVRGNARLALVRLVLVPLIRAVDVVTAAELLILNCPALLVLLRKKFSEAGEARDFLIQAVDK